MVGTAATFLMSYIMACGGTDQRDNTTESQTTSAGPATEPVVETPEPVVETPVVKQATGTGPGSRVQFEPEGRSESYYPNVASGYVLDPRSTLARSCSANQKAIQYLDTQTHHATYPVQNGRVYCIDNDDVYIDGKYKHPLENRSISYYDSGFVDKGYARLNYETDEQHPSWDFVMFRGDPMHGYKPEKYTGDIVDVEWNGLKVGFGGYVSSELGMTILVNSSTAGPADSLIGTNATFSIERVTSTSEGNW